jgi:signal transduction histidine kinase/CheY-like chemotaxis protein/HPt (histidine-containing phosphotransfer) domain-containing protein
MLDTGDPAALKAEIKRLELELKKTNRQLSAAQARLERFSNVNVMQHEVVGAIKTEMSRQEKFMTMLLKYSKNTILLLDRELKVAYYTDNFFRETVAGKEPSDIEGQSIFSVHEKYFGAAAAVEIKKVIENAIASKKTQITKETIPSHGGRHLIYYLYVTAMSGGGELDGVILLYTNITELEDARVKAEAASRTKSEFLAKMSHEIRTPMNAIIGMSDLMPAENLSPLQKGYFEDIKKMSKSLLTIINDILDFSKIEAGKLELAPVHYNMHTLFDSIASMCEFIARGKGLEFRRAFDKSTPEILYGDEIRVRQIFTNIVNNAVKYTKKGCVSFSLFRGKREADGMRTFIDETGYLVAEIKDSGIGIKEEDIPKLFGSFQQLDAQKNRGIMGTGLGLAITKSFVSMMGGRIEVKSVYGSGSTFTVYLPLVEGDPAKIEKAEDIPSVMANGDVRVLVVDDVPVNLTVALAFLVKHGVNAETASGGFEAVAKVRQSVESGRPYDIVFMDHMMPDLDGVEAAKQIRARAQGDTASAYLSLPIVALSANAVQGAEELFLASGMNGFVAKPIEPLALNAALKKFLPAEKYTLEDPGKSGVSAKERNPRKETLFGELAKIEGLDIVQGLHYAAESFETYTATLKHFSAGMEKGLAVIRGSLAAEDWKPYTVRVHAYKGICATIGAGELAEWGKKLEAASKTDDKSACRGETEDYCRALEKFNAALRGTSLFAEDRKTEKSEIPAADMAGKIREFAAACEEGRAVRIKDAVKELETVSLAGAPGGFEADLEQALDFARALDCDEAAEKARELYAQLEKQIRGKP